MCLIVIERRTSTRLWLRTRIATLLSLILVNNIDDLVRWQKSGSNIDPKELYRQVWFLCWRKCYFIRFESFYRRNFVATKVHEKSFNTKSSGKRRNRPDDQICFNSSESRRSRWNCHWLRQSLHIWPREAHAKVSMIFSCFVWIQGDVLPSTTGGVNVIFNDVERLTCSSPPDPLSLHKRCKSEERVLENVRFDFSVDFDYCFDRVHSVSDSFDVSFVASSTSCRSQVFLFHSLENRRIRSFAFFCRKFRMWKFVRLAERVWRARQKYSLVFYLSISLRSSSAIEIDSSRKWKINFSINWMKSKISMTLGKNRKLGERNSALRFFFRDRRTRNKRTFSSFWPWANCSIVSLNNQLGTTSRLNMKIINSSLTKVEPWRVDQLRATPIDVFIVIR